MSTILEQIKQAQKQYRLTSVKEGNHRAKIKAKVLTTLIGEAENKIKGKAAFGDTETVVLVKKFVDGINEMMAARPSDDLLVELEALNIYIPRQLSEVEIQNEVSHIIENWESEITSQDMGKIMGVLKKAHGASLNGGIASKVVKAAIAERV